MACTSDLNASWHSLQAGSRKGEVGCTAAGGDVFDRGPGFFFRGLLLGVRGGRVMPSASSMGSRVSLLCWFTRWRCKYPGWANLCKTQTKYVRYGILSSLLAGANLFYKKNPPKSSVIIPNPSRGNGPTTLTSQTKRSSKRAGRLIDPFPQEENHNMSIEQAIKQ